MRGNILTLFAYVKFVRSYTCDSSCHTCSGGHYYDCTSCSSSNFRQLYNSNYCICTNGYFQSSGQETCLSCSQVCNQVTSPSHSSCLFYEGYNSLCYVGSNTGSQYCNCFYDGSSSCLACDPTCLICASGSNSACTSCSSSTMNRTLIGNKCICKSSYYDSGFSVCIACDYTCLTCIPSTQCISCQASSYRTFSSSSCPCNAKYYDDGSSAVCQQCNHSCDTCWTISTKCLTCSSVNHRTLNSNSCPCDTQYYDDGTSAMCLVCNYSCLSCSGSSIYCLTCKTANNRSFVGNQCPCNINYYDINNAVCATCDYTCDTCSGSSKNCISCSTTSLRSLVLNQCICNDNYYDDGSTSVCQVCDYSCLTCTGSSSLCLTCSGANFRTLVANQCLCNGPYYDNNTAICANCHFSCLTCSAPSQINCLTCLRDNYRSLIANQCVCNGTYYNNNTAVCQSCHYSCLTCSDSTSDSCITCQTYYQRTLSNNQCLCNSNYFDNQTKVCAGCDPTCEMCSMSSIQCTTCSVSNYRQIQKNSCPCIIGYFNDGLAVCAKCDYSCLECSGSSTTCISCPTNFFRELSLSSCPCKIRYYDVGSQICLACDQSCFTCLGSSDKQCDSCSSLNHRLLSSSSCPCKINYYDDNSAVCASCHPSCETCFSSTDTTCLTCLNNDNRVLKNHTCVCQGSFYDDVSTLNCQSCYILCQTCSGQQINDCLSCDDSMFRTLINNQCECLGGYEEVNQGCVQIKIQPGNLLTQILRPLCQLRNCLQFTSSVCSACMPQYFLDNNYCTKCDDKCSVCTGIDQNQCQRCKYIKVDQKCKFCEELQGLYTIKQKCESICGDKIVYGGKEQCDDGNLDDSDGCNSLCKKVPILYSATMNIDADQMLYSNIRTAIISFDLNYTMGFQNWSISIPQYDLNYYKIEQSFTHNKLKIIITMNASLKGKKLLVITSQHSHLFKHNLEQSLPDYEMVSQQDIQSTTQVLKINDYFLYSLWIIMALCVFIGGFDMVWNILDLLQIFSYLKYCNVIFPYNVEVFFNFMATFNLQSLQVNIPLIYEYSTYLFGYYTSSDQTKGPKKMLDDGFSTLFLFNFICIMTAWLSAFIIYLASTILVKLFTIFGSLENVQSSKGFINKIRLLRHKISNFMIYILKDYNGQFVYTGMLRIFITTGYDMNFALFLELNNLHFSSDKIVLTLSTIFGIIVFLLQIGILYKISSIMTHYSQTQMKNQRLVKQIGSMTEGLKINKRNSLIMKHFYLISHVKKILFMFTLVFLYNKPIYQIGALCLYTQLMLLIHIVFLPLKQREEQIKCLICEAFVFIALLLMFLFAVEKELNMTSVTVKFNVGWVIIGCCLLALAIQIIVDIKVHIFYMVTLCRKMRAVKKNNRTEFKNSPIRNQPSLVLEWID